MNRQQRRAQGRRIGKALGEVEVARRDFDDQHLNAVRQMRASATEPPAELLPQVDALIAHLEGDPGRVLVAAAAIDELRAWRAELTQPAQVH